MISQGFTKKLIILLSISLVVLLAANLIFNYIFNNGSNLSDIQQAGIHESFLTSIKSFGLEDEWIKAKTVKEKNSKNEFIKYSVFVPRDLTIPEILLDVYQTFKDDSVNIETSEIKAGGKSFLNIQMHDKTILQAEFDYKKNLSRSRGSIAFLITGIEPGNTDDSLLIESPGKYCVLLKPSEEDMDYLNYLNTNRKDFAILLDDEINEQNYRLGASYTQKRLLGSIKSLTTDFSKAVFFVIDVESDLFKSENYNYLHEQITKRNIKLIRMSEFTSLNDPDKNIEEQFKDQVKLLKKDRAKLFLLGKDEYNSLQEEIYSFEKSGMHIINVGTVYYD